MADLRQSLTFASSVYRRRLGFAYHGYVRRDPMARPHLRIGRDNPYAVYESMRRRGSIQRTRLGDWVTVSHQVCSTVLRDRRFGVRTSEMVNPGGDVRDEFDMSFLDRDPPDHTRLRRLAQPAFSPKQMARYRPRVEATVDRLLALPGVRPALAIHLCGGQGALTLTKGVLGIRRPFPRSRLFDVGPDPEKAGEVVRAEWDLLVAASRLA